MSCSCDYPWNMVGEFVWGVTRPMGRGGGTLMFLSLVMDSKIRKPSVAFRWEVRIDEYKHEQPFPKSFRRLSDMTYQTW